MISNLSTRRLLRSAAPVTGESLRGLVADACARNHISNTWGMLQHFGLLHRNRVDVSESAELQVVDLAVALGTAEYEIASRRYEMAAPGHRSFFGLQLNASRIENRLRRFSPAAIGAGCSYHPAVHELRDLPFSPLGWDLLRISCPCEPAGQRQGWTRTNGTARCDGCGGRLDRIEPILVPAELRPSLSFLAKLVDPDAGLRAAAMTMLPSCIRTADRNMLFDVITSLGNGLAKLDSAVNGLAACEGLARACDAVLQWPGGLTLVESKGPSQNERWARARRNYLMLDVCREEVDAVHSSPSKATYVPSGACGRVTNNCVSALEAARHAGIDEVALKEAWDQDLLTQHVRVVRGERVRAFDPDEVQAIAPQLRRAKARVRTAKLLGSTVFGVEQMIAMRLLQPGSPVGGRSQWEAHRQEAAHLIARLKRGAQDEVANPVRLSDAVRFISGRPKPWGPIFEMLLVGDLPYTWKEADSSPVTNQIVISSQHLAPLRSTAFDKAAFASENFESRWSQKDALDCINGYKNAVELLSPLAGSSTSPRHFLATEVETLAQAGVTTSDLARRSATSVTRTLMILEKAGVPQLAPGLWQRDLAEPLLTI